MYRDKKRDWYLKGDALLEEIAHTRAADEGIAVWYTGQCGFVLRQRCIIYIDPVLNDISDETGVSLRWYDAPCAPEQVKTDYVLCTHGHADHLAQDTVRGIAMANPQALFIVPGACKEMLLSCGVMDNQILEAVSGKEICLPDLTIIPVATAHPDYETDETGREKSLAYYITCGGISVLHLGDTSLTQRLVSDLKRCGRPDILMVPVNGSDLFREQRNIIGNMSATEAALLAKELGADLTVPMHYDMIKGNTASPLHFVEALWEADAAMKTALPVPGERIIYQKPYRQLSGHSEGAPGSGKACRDMIQEVQVENTGL